MKRYALAAGELVGLGLFGSPADAADPSRSIVKQYVTPVDRDVTTPWRPGWNYQATGSGAVIEGGRVLTAAHVVNDQTFVHLVEIQMDAAIAPGSSGGPLVHDGRIVGVAMQGFKDSPIGCAVPGPLVRQFLADVADGRVDGIPTLGLAWQKLENPALKASLRVPAGATGVLVTRVDGAPAAGVLREGDVLLSVAGKDVADDGKVELRPGERTGLSQATDLLPVGVDDPMSSPRAEDCECRLVYGLVNERIAEVLRDYTLADLLDPNWATGRAAAELRRP